VASEFVGHLDRRVDRHRLEEVGAAELDSLRLVYVGFVLYRPTFYVSKMHKVGAEPYGLPIERWKLLIIMPSGTRWSDFGFSRFSTTWPPARPTTYMLRAWAPRAFAGVAG